MSKLTVITVSAVKTEKARYDGKPQREFVTITFADKSNPFNVRTYTRNIFQRLVGDANSWGATSPAILKSLEGKQVDGCAIATEFVHEFEIEGRKVNKHTLALLPHESTSPAAIARAFREQGHPLISDAPLATADNSTEIKAEAVATADLRTATVEEA